MIVLTDTCSVIMLLRIAPEMFNDEQFGCVTIQAVHDEIKRTPKFKIKYPWRSDFLPKIKAIPPGELSKIAYYVENGKTVARTLDSQRNSQGAPYGLSRVDREVERCGGIEILRHRKAGQGSRREGGGKMKILSIQRVVGRGVIQYVDDDGNAGAVRFNSSLSDAEAMKLISDSGADADIEELRARAAGLGVRGVISNMKPDTLKKKIAEAEEFERD